MFLRVLFSQLKRKGEDKVQLLVSSYLTICDVISQLLQQNLAATVLLPKQSAVGNIGIIQETIAKICVIQLDSQWEDFIQAQLDLLIPEVVLTLIINARCPMVFTITRNTCPMTWTKNCCNIKAEKTGPQRPRDKKKQVLHLHTPYTEKNMRNCSCLDITFPGLLDAVREDSHPHFLICTSNSRLRGQ